MSIRRSVSRSELLKLVLLILSAQFLSPAFGQSQSGDSIAPFHVENLGAPLLLKDISRKSGIVIGLEMDLLFAKMVRMSRDFPGGSKEDLARLCASLLDGGTWSIGQDGSVLISAPGRAQALGSVLIQVPQVTKTTRRAVWESLSSDAGVNHWLRENQCKRAEIFSGYEWRQVGKTFNVPQGEMPLNRLLELATVGSGATSWSILKNDREGQCEINIILWW